MQKTSTSTLRERAELATAELTAIRANDKASMLAEKLNDLEQLTQSLTNLANNVQTDLENGLANTQETSDQVKALQEQMSLLRQSVATIQTTSNNIAQTAQTSLDSMTQAQASIGNHQATLNQATANLSSQAKATIKQLNQATAELQQQGNTAITAHAEYIKAFTAYMIKKHLAFSILATIALLPIIFYIISIFFLNSKLSNLKQSVADEKSAQVLLFQQAERNTGTFKTEMLQILSYQMTFMDTPTNNISATCQPKTGGKTTVILTSSTPKPR